MKNLITVLLLVLSINSYAQEKITVSINGSEIFIETYTKSSLGMYSSDKLSLDDANRLDLVR